jgi:hypothetical protein
MRRETATGDYRKLEARPLAQFSSKMIKSKINTKTAHRLSRRMRARTIN